MKLINYKSILIFFIIVFVGQPIAHAEDPAFVLQQLMTFRTYVATVAQSTYDVHGHRLQQGRGLVMIMRPGFFRWETDAPTRQVLMTNGKTLWVYDVDLAQATRQPLQQRTNINPASLLSGSITDLKQQFNISIQSTHKGQQFLLQPKQDNMNFRWITLSFKKDHLVSMKVLNNLDEVSEFLFTQIRINTPLSPYLFQFKPAAGVDIVTK